MVSNGRLAVVTGTTSGIGRAVASGLLDRGWEVVGLARRAAPFTRERYTHIRADLGDTSALTALCRLTLAPLLGDPARRRLALVNNAALIGSLRRLGEADPDHLGRMFAVNSTAPILLMALALRTVPAAVPVRIVNVSTAAAHSPFAGLGDYSATKAALRLAGMTLAKEIEMAEPRPDAAILSYEPGLVDTPMQDAARGADPAVFPAQASFQEFADRGLLHPPVDVVADVAAFLDADPAETFSEKRFGG